MEEVKELKVHGVPEPKGQLWLKDVRLDATRAAIQHLKTQKERQDFKKAKAHGITVEEILSQGKADLGVDAPETPRRGRPALAK